MAKKKVCIDAGHSGKYNRSPVVKSYYESDMNWKLHLLLKTELEKRGIEVTTTRKTQNTELSVTARGKMANGSDLFLSLHSNAAEKESVDYVAVYHMTSDTTTKIDEESKALAEKIAPVIAKEMGVKQGSRTLSRKSGNDRNGDGRMNDNYYGVLHGARMVGVPGLILEHSFHTNTAATKWLLDDSNLAKLAKAEADVVAEYFGVGEADTPIAGNAEEKEEVCNVDIKVLKKGAKGAEVKALQILLIGYGHSCGSSGADGSLGPATDKAIRAFQKEKSLTVDGICGPKTWAKLLGLS